ncbi:hypothetical protein [Streptomyces sp.]|uniref:hypothetical protein n=1 Tax=Streptomyces sp. TaxID=1931 RepID=UPI002F42D60A
MHPAPAPDPTAHPAVDPAVDPAAGPAAEPAVVQTAVLQPVAPYPAAPRPAVPRADGGRAARRRAAAAPVFVDASGRRQRRVRRLGRFLVIPAAGYVALLLSALLGGPSVPSPYLPLPEPGAHPTGERSGPGSRPTVHRTPATTGSASPGAGTVPPMVSSTTPAARPPTTAPKPTAPTATHGKSAVTHPVPQHTRRGHP